MEPPSPTAPNADCGTPEPAAPRPWREDYNALLYVLAGQGSVGIEERPIGTGQLAVFGAGNAVTVGAARIQESRTPNLDGNGPGGRPPPPPPGGVGGAG